MSAPLLAFTESGLKATALKDKDRKNHPSRSKSKSSFTTSSHKKPTRFTQPRPRGSKKKETITFDDQARNEFLTGFSKRKAARKEAARKVNEEKALEERKVARKEARQARKEQAAENVRAERKHFQGSDYEGSEDESQDGEDDEEEEEEETGWKEVDANAPPPAPQEFETSSHKTTVTIQAFDPDADDLDVQPELLPTTSTSSKPSLKRKAVSEIELLPASSRRSMKKEKNEKERLKLEKEKRKEEERKNRKSKSSFNSSKEKGEIKSITSLLEPVLNTEFLKPAPQSTSSSSKTLASNSNGNGDGGTQVGGENKEQLALKRKEKAFKYETALERAKQRAHNADQRNKRKEKRLQEEESMRGVKGFMLKGGKGKQGMRKKSGKAGSGGVGSKGKDGKGGKKK